MKLTAHFEIITPVFCAGANQKGPSEIREFAIKGMLRWFYRALDGGCGPKREGELFGAATGNEGSSSPIVLRVDPRVVGTKLYGSELNPRYAKERGECYLGYTLYLGENQRQAIEPGFCFKIHLSPRWRKPDQDVWKAWLAALWLLGHLGGIGSRMRRGFGTIALTGLEGDWPEKAELPLPYQAQSLDEWHQRFTQGYKVVRRWFPSVRSADSPQPSLPSPLWFLIGPPFENWLLALRHIGNLMRNYRAQKHIPGHGGKYPRNAAFGLPLASQSLSNQIIPTSDFDRSPSRLWIRVIRVGGHHYPMVWLQHSALLPSGEIRWKRSGWQPENLPVPSGLGVLRDFLTHLRTQGYQ